MKKQLCLISGEIMPNLIGILHEKPDSVIPIVTAQSADQVTNLDRALNAAGCNSSIEDSVTVLPYDLPDCLATIREKCQIEDEITVNWTGGTKIMSYAARTVAAEIPRARSIYINTTDGIIIEDGSNCQTPVLIPLDPGSLGINSLVHILAAGHRVDGDESLGAFRLKHTPPVELQEAAELLVDASRKEWRDLFGFAGADKTTYRPVHVSGQILAALENAKIIAPSRNESYFLAENSLLVPFNRKTPQEENAKFIRGGYLEVFLWTQLYKRGAFDDVAWHVTLNPGQRGRMSEFDVTVASEGRFLIIESKGRVEENELANLIEEQYARSRRVGRLFGRWIIYIHLFKEDFNPSVVASQEARAKDFGGKLLWHEDLDEIVELVGDYLQEIKPSL